MNADGTQTSAGMSSRRMTWKKMFGFLIIESGQNFKGLFISVKLNASQLPLKVEAFYSNICCGIM